jgi:hypothetical protein
MDRRARAHYPFCACSLCALCSKTATILCTAQLSYCIKHTVTRLIGCSWLLSFLFPAVLQMFVKLLYIVELSQTVPLAHSVLRLVTYDPFTLVPLSSYLLENASSAFRSGFSLLLRCERNEFLYLLSFPLDKTYKSGRKIVF